jgi:hypothetical protein
MIIDGGSYNNFANSDMVDNLALSTKPHPPSIAAMWFVIFLLATELLCVFSRFSPSIAAMWFVI